MQSALDVVARPFAAFFAEAFDEVRGRRLELDLRRRPRVPQNDEEPRLGLCAECLQPADACVCD